MGYAIRHHPDHRLAVVTLTGTVVGLDFARAIAEAAGHPAWEPSFAMAWDGRAAASYGLLPEEVEEVVGAFRRAVPGGEGGRTAIVVREASMGPVMRLVAERTQAATERERRFFEAPPAAAAWLGVPASLLGRPARTTVTA